MTGRHYEERSKEMLLHSLARALTRRPEEKPQVKAKINGDVAQLEERLLGNSLDSCAVLTCCNAGSCAPKTS
jgi:hypothetical protein